MANELHPASRKSNEFGLECYSDSEVTYLRLRGQIDSGFDLNLVSDYVDGVKLIVDVSELQGITDLGRRAWRRTLDHLCDHAKEVLLWDCPPDLTSQFNATPALVSLAKLASYRTTYRCSRCDADVPIRIDATTLEACDLDEGHFQESDTRREVLLNDRLFRELSKHSAKRHTTASLQSMIAALLTSPPRVEGIGRTVPARERSQVTAAALRRTTHFTGAPIEPQRSIHLKKDNVFFWASVILVFLGGAATGYGLRPTDLPKQAIVDFALSLNDGNFGTAEQILSTYKDELPNVLVDIYRFELDSAENEAAEIYRRQAQRAFRRQNYDDAVGYAVEAIAIDDSDRDMVFLVADAHRLSGRKEEALDYYKTFIEGSPRDELADDAMYWCAEVLAERGQHDEARDLLNRVLARRQSNFRRSASRLLAQLPKG